MSLPPPTPAQARIIWLALTGLALATLASLLVALIWGLGQVLDLLWPVLWPIAFAGVIAYLLDPVVDFLVRRNVPRQRAIIVVSGLALMIILGLAGSVLPQIIVETRQLAQKVPDYTNRLQHRIENWVNNPPALVQKFLLRDAQAVSGTNAVTATNAIVATNASPATNATGTASVPASPTAAPGGPTLLSKALDSGNIQSATEFLARGVPKAAAWLFGQVSKVAAWFGVLAGLALVPVYAFYFLLEKQGIERKWTDYIPVVRSGFRDELVFVLRSINDYLIVFFRGQVLVAICDGIMYTIGFIIVGLPYAVLLGAMATVLTMIPFLGAIATCAAALIIAFVQFGDWKHPALVLCVFAVVQTIEGLVVQPKIMGDRVGLHPLTIIIAVMVGTTLLGGILGGILAIPLTAALKVIMFRYVWKKPV